MVHTLKRFIVYSSQLLISCVPVFLEAQDSETEDILLCMQENLSPEEVVLIYNLTDSNVSVTAIDQFNIVSASGSLNDLFWESLIDFRKKIKSADPDNFMVFAELMYFYLVMPVQELLAGKHRLIIIPDDILNELPFEAFILRPTVAWFNHKEVPHFLICDFEVVYRRPEFVFRACRGGGKTNSGTITQGDQFAFMGFSPGLSGHSLVDQLPGAVVELSSIGALYRKNGLSFWVGEGNYSKKDNFKRMVNKGKIIHLATHYFNDSGASCENGFLFSGSAYDHSCSPVSEEILTMDEIGAMEFHADLVVLNACGSGMLRSKRGTVHNIVPRVFLEAGAQNIVSTLWNVNDNLAGDFMIDFYRHLLSGKTYGAALREAKLRMLRSRETSLPLVWAPYILTEK